MRDQSHQHSRDAHLRHGKDDKAKLNKKRNLLEVFKKPSNAKEIGKPVKQRTSSHAIDKFELECIEMLKVTQTCLIIFCTFFWLQFVDLTKYDFQHISAYENSGRCKKRTHLSHTNVRKCYQKEVFEWQHH